ncbi:hypothetical protein ACJJTC_002307 [Scirpophaga incertulas]
MDTTETITLTTETKKDWTEVHPRKYIIVPQNFIKIGYIHLSAFYGIYLCLTSAKWQTLIFTYICYVVTMIGVTAGAHRLWSHKAYKAKYPLQIILITFLSMANQRLTHWVRDHRTHHKYSDTDADPHNASRGFFFSHIGWMFVKKHPLVKEKGSQISLADLYQNPVVSFQHKYAPYMTKFFCFVLPTTVPIYFWGETLNNSWNINMMRYVLNMHFFFLVNSIAHIWGNKPYNQFIKSVENKFVTMATLGEGFHNFHHTFPHDYKSSELGHYTLNYTTAFIDFFAWVGWAYDLRTASPEGIARKADRDGDGTRKISNVDDYSNSNQTLIQHSECS